MKFRFAVVAALALGVASAAQAEIRPHEFKVGIGLNADHPQAESVRKFDELLRARSGGKLTAKLFASGTLGSDVTMTSALRGGTQDMTIPDTSVLVSIVKDFGVLNMPLNIRNEKEADALLDGPFGQKLLEKLPEKGLIGLAWQENGFRNLTNNRRPVTKAEDIEGLKVRVIQNPLFIDTFKTLGANALPLPFPEVYSALEQKAVDGQENPLATILSSKYYEVQQYLTLSRHIYSAWVMLLSKKVWDKLNDEEREIVRGAAREASLFERKRIREFSGQALAELKAKGMKVSELSDADRAAMQKKLAPVAEKFSKEFGEGPYHEMMSELQRIRGEK